MNYHEKITKSINESIKSKKFLNSKKSIKESDLNQII